MVLDDDHPDTQISAVEGSRGTGSGQAESKADKERGEVATPTHRCVWQYYNIMAKREVS